MRIFKEETTDEIGGFFYFAEIQGSHHAESFLKSCAIDLFAMCVVVKSEVSLCRESA